MCSVVYVYGVCACKVYMWQSEVDIGYLSWALYTFTLTGVTGTATMPRFLHGSWRSELSVILVRQMLYQVSCLPSPWSIFLGLFFLAYSQATNWELMLVQLGSAPYRFICSNAWCLVGGTVWRVRRCAQPFWGRCFTEAGFEVQKILSFPIVPSLLPDCGSKCEPLPTLNLWNHKPFPS